MPTSKIKWSEFFIFKGSATFIFVITFCLAISAFLGALTPQLITELPKQYDNIDAYFVAMKKLLILFVAVYANRSIYQACVNKYVKLLVQHVRSLCYRRWLLYYDIQTQKTSRSERYPMGEVISRLINDTESLRELITSGTFGIFIDLFFVLSYLFGFISINKISGIALTSLEILAAALLIWGSKYMRKIFLSVRKSRGHVSRTLASVVGGLQETYYTRHDHYASKKGEVSFDDFLGKQLKANVWDASYYSLAESLYPILLAMVVFIFPYSKIVEAAIIFAIVDLIQRSINPIKDIAGKVTNIQRAASGIQRIHEFLEDLCSGPSSPETGLKEAIEFRKLKVKVPFFSYPKRNEQGKHESFALKDIEFEAKKGELIGIVGLSGSGKSTLLNILSANIVPDQLELTIEDEKERHLTFSGKDLSDIVRYREQVGIVSQDSHIFSESLLFNITLGDQRDEEFEVFWHWIKERIPYLEFWGLAPSDKVNPQSLSMGQKQLLCAIRSCFLKRPIVLFDEISSGLDSELELALRKVILLVQEHSLTIIVAHRLETVLGADCLLVMNHGEIVDRGRHSELHHSSAIYRQFIAEVSHSNS